MDGSPKYLVTRKEGIEKRSRGIEQKEKWEKQIQKGQERKQRDCIDEIIKDITMIIDLLIERF